MADRLKGKVAIITGGTGGMGLGIAGCFLREGAKVAITDIKENEASKALVAQNAGQVLFETLNVTDESAWKQVIQDTVNQFGSLSILVNNAGIAPQPVPIDQEPYEDWKKVIDVNLNGNFLGVKYGMKEMKGKGGSIINISSIEGMVGQEVTGPYNASKGGTRLLTKAAALDAAANHYNVRINSVHPGFIDTPIIPREAIKPLADSTPLGHIGEPKDIGEICVYLASDESKFATGSEFTVDGGFTAR